MIRNFERTEILGWSFSRYASFSSCKRLYYYEKYSRYDLRHDQGKIHALKKLTSVPLEIGNITHKIIRVLLHRLRKTSEPINVEKFFDFAYRKGREIFAEKEFDEVYYGVRDAVDFDLEIYPSVRAALENLLTSDTMQWIFEEALVTKDDWVIEPDGYGECRIDNLKAFCRVDFVFPIGDDLHILDWKTGRPNHSRHMSQLRGYTVWANYHFEKDFSQIHTTIAHLLPEYEEYRQRVNEYDLEEFSLDVRSQTEEMYEYCAEPEFNIPLPKDQFEMTRAENFCKTCKFRELCERA